MEQKYSPFRRNRFFSGKLLGVEDFEAEQSYHLGKRRLLNRILFGAGVAEGLACHAENGQVRVEPGVAIDCLGREIVVPESRLLELPAGFENLYVCVSYGEREVEPVPAPAASTGESPTEHSRIEETFEIVLAETFPFAHHRERSGRWTCCGNGHPVPLARVTRMWKGIAVQRP